MQSLQVYEYRYNVLFSETYASVSYTNHNFQIFSSQESCVGCTLSDIFVGVNRCSSSIPAIADPRATLPVHAACTDAMHVASGHLQLCVESDI